MSIVMTGCGICTRTCGAGWFTSIIGRPGSTRTCGAALLHAHGRVRLLHADLGLRHVDLELGTGIGLEAGALFTCLREAQCCPADLWLRRTAALPAIFCCSIIRLCLRSPLACWTCCST